MNAPEQVIDRRAFLGGSDAAAVLKCSPYPYATPLGTYLRKIDEPTLEMLEHDAKMSKVFRRGKREEPNVINDLAEDLGVKITRRSLPGKKNYYTDPEFDFLRAEVDFEFEVTAELAALVADDQPEIAKALRDLIGTVQNGEVKTHIIFNPGLFGQEGTDQCPIEYTAQAMHGLMVSGRQICMFAVRSSLDDLRVYWVLRDESIIKTMRPGLVRFWRENVLARVEPDPIRQPDLTALFRRRDVIRVEASAEAVAWLGEFETAKSQARVALEQVEEMKFQIGKFMLGADSIVRPVGPRGGKNAVEPTAAAPKKPHELLINGAAVLLVSLQEQVRLDTAKVQKEHPDVAAACSKEISFFKYGKPPKPKPVRSKRGRRK